MHSDPLPPTYTHNGTPVSNNVSPAANTCSEAVMAAALATLLGWLAEEW